MRRVRIMEQRFPGPAADCDMLAPLMRRREALFALSASLTQLQAAVTGVRPANRRVRWAVSASLWNHFQPVAFTDILDIMRDTGFPGIRLTGFPGILKTYHMTAAQIEREVSKRDLHVVTISFNGPAYDPAQQKKVVADAKAAMEFLHTFGAKHLVVFSPSRRGAADNPDAAFRTMCETFNQIGSVAGEMGFRAGLHNHLNQMVERPAEVDRCMALTDPKLFWFSPDTAHLHLGGSDVPKTMEKYKSRLMFADYKDARWTAPASDVTLDNGKVHLKDSSEAKFFSSIYDLGDGEIDFPACHRILKSINYDGWICVDLDAARRGPRLSYERCGKYIVDKLEPIYA